MVKPARHHAAFDAETLALFVRLEAVPPRRRRAQWFKEDERRLAKMLGLNAELFFSIISVLDRERSSPSPERPQYLDWVKVQQVRNALLAAAGAAVGDTIKTKQ
jgi:hypothetical protein